MNANRLRALTNRGSKPPGPGKTQHGPRRASQVLGDRNPAVVAVGAWVETGQDLLDHPATLALLTEELQAQITRENEDNLRRFQVEVRQRVVHRGHVYRRWQQPHVHPSETYLKVSKLHLQNRMVLIVPHNNREVLQPSTKVVPQRRAPHYQVTTHQVSANEESISSAAQQNCPPQLTEPMRQVRLRLAACRLIQQEETASDLPGGRWNISPTRHGAEQEEEEEEMRDIPLFDSHHECPLVQQKVGRHALFDHNNLHSDHGSNASLEDPSVLWPMTDQEKVKKQRQSQFLKNRRLAMNTEREQVKENRQLRTHLRRNARIKAEKEQLRLEEERKLERAQRLLEGKQRLKERELLILERLRLEEEEDRAVQLQRRNRQEKEKDSARFVEALRAQVKERLSQMRLDLPPLCCCASSFWDSHPNTCANNCVFHDDPRAYAKALHSTLVSLDLQ